MWIEKYLKKKIPENRNLRGFTYFTMLFYFFVHTLRNLLNNLYFFSKKKKKENLDFNMKISN